MNAVDLTMALEWIQDIADKNYEQDPKLRHQGARTLKRISDKVDEVLGEKKTFMVHFNLAGSSYLMTAEVAARRPEQAQALFQKENPNALISMHCPEAVK